MKIALINLSHTLVGDTSYVIHLKNGGRFMTPHYWEKDSPGKPGENSEKKKLQEELRTLEAESATAAEKYYNATNQPKQERDNVRKEIFTTSQKKRKIFQKLQETNQ